MGAGAAEGSTDASNLIKPALSRGELHAIGATTLDEYRKYIEADKALERRFQPVYTSEPSVESTIAILRGLQERYEVHHGVRIKDEALVAAAVLSNRYITNRFLPDKAIDLIDEAASQLKMEIESQPEQLDQIERKILQLNIEEQALKRESDKASKKRLEKLTEERNTLQSERDVLHAQWEEERFDRSDPEARPGSNERARKTPSARGRPRQSGADQARRDSRVGAGDSDMDGSAEAEKQEIGSSAKRSAKKTSPRSSPTGRGFPSPR